MKELYHPRIPELFLEGRFSDISEIFEQQKKFTKRKELFSYWIGSLIFSGQLNKALVLYQHETVSKSVQCACRFYLALGFIRNSQYKEGRKYLIENLGYLRSSNMNISGQDKFFVYQGLAFFRFFCGRFSNAKKYAALAFSHSVQGQFLFGEMLSKELLAHTLIHTGEIRLGLKYFQEIHLIAQKNRSWLAPAIESAVLKFKFQFGIEKDLAFLEEALEKIETRDVYSKGELMLELIRQHILRGHFTKAEETMSKAAEIIYKSQNRRQMALFNLRMAYVLYLQAQHSQSLHILRFAEQNIDASIDLNLWLQINGLKFKLFFKLKKTNEAQELRKDLNAKNRRSQNVVHTKMMSRFNTTRSQLIAKGEDPLGDLLDEVATGNPKSPELVLKSGYYGLLHKCYKLPFGSRCLIFDLHPRTLIILDKGNVILKSKGFNSVLRKILTLIKDSPKSKEFLVQEVWGYDYDPQRHDSLIYSSINKIRSLLNPHADWIQLTEEGYYLSSSVKVIIKNSLQSSPQTQTQTHRIKSEKKIPQLSRKVKNLNRWSKYLKDLNYRQLQILDYLKKSSSLSVQELSMKLLISKPTATRDLSKLYDLGIVTRIGQGRATRYFL